MTYFTACDEQRGRFISLSILFTESRHFYFNILSLVYIKRMDIQIHDRRPSYSLAIRMKLAKRAFELKEMWETPPKHMHMGAS